MKRENYTTFVGVDLGGARGKTTAVARLVRRPGDELGSVEIVSTRAPGPHDEPWSDRPLLSYLSSLGEGAVIAIDAPLTVPACVRCTAHACPGAASCEVPAVAWLRNFGAELAEQALADRDRIAAIPTSSGFTTATARPERSAAGRLAPYNHRCTEASLHQSGLLPAAALGRATGSIAARAAHLRRVLAGTGFELNENLLEVSPRVTVHALFGERLARGYKKDADPWETRAEIIEELSRHISFAPTSCFSREQVLRNDNCFDALLSAYTAFLWACEGWELPEDVPANEDGWIWAPEPR